MQSGYVSFVIQDTVALVMAKILIAEDDTAFAEAICELLKHGGHSAETVPDGGEANDRLRLYSYDLAILDWNLPGKTGVEICQELRKGGKQIPVLMMTAKATINDKQTGFDCGADDYLTKPFDLKELVMRVTALLRRPSGFVPTTLKVGGISLDWNQQSAMVESEPIALLPKEFALLEFLMKHPNELVTAEAMLDKIWNSESDTTSGVIKAHIHNLRKKLKHVKNPVIETVHGLGYRLSVVSGSSNSKVTSRSTKLSK